MSEHLFCRQPDRDAEAIGLKNSVCGYPLPCPHHTLVVQENGHIHVPPHADISWQQLKEVRKAVDIIQEHPDD